MLDTYTAYSVCYSDGAKGLPAAGNVRQCGTGRNGGDYMVSEIFERVRREKPLVHHLTNWVTIYQCANMTRAFGAFPVMAHAIEESAEMAGIASALVLNIGTLTPGMVHSMIAAGQKANDIGIPVVFDAVGVGATALRNEKAAEILDSVHVDIIKGNASEIAKLAGEDVVTRGVETTDVEADLIHTAGKLAKSRNATVVVTGVEDVVTDGTATCIVRNGHEMMGAVVGTGCMAASVIGAFAGVERDYVKAAAAALVCYEVAGELAAKTANGPGSMLSGLYDEVYTLDSGTIERMVNIEQK